MKKINLKKYSINVMNKDGEIKPVDYDVNESIVAIMFHRGLNLNMIDTIKSEDIARKILDAKEFVVLEDAEYSRVKKAFDTFTGFGRNDVELCKRILNAEDVKIGDVTKVETETVPVPVQQ